MRVKGIHRLRTIQQLQHRIDYLEKDLKEKQFVIDIKTWEAQNLKHIVDLMLNAADLARVIMKERELT